MKKKITTLLLAMLILLQIVACAESSENPEDASAPAVTSTEVSASEETAAETEAEDNLEAVAAQFSGRDYDGYSFRILDREGSWETVDVMAEEMTGEAINDAVLERNNLLSEKLNVVVVEQRNSSPYTTMKTAVTAQSDDFDTVTDGLSRLASTVANGIIYDYREIPEVKMENGWRSEEHTSELQSR